MNRSTDILDIIATRKSAGERSDKFAITGFSPSKTTP